MSAAVRWTRAESRALLPLPAADGACVLALVKPPAIDGSRSACVSVQRADGTDPSPPREVPTGQWSWQVWRVHAAEREGAPLWFRLATDPAWNSGLRGYPKDLGLCVAGLAVLPAP